MASERKVLAVAELGCECRNDHGASRAGSQLTTIEKFIDTDSMDPVYYECPGGERDVYAVLRKAIAKMGKIALARLVISQHERTIAILRCSIRRLSPRLHGGRSAISYRGSH
jgi:Ku70/Ku80 beta-barrel domain